MKDTDVRAVWMANQAFGRQSSGKGQEEVDWNKMKVRCAQVADTEWENNVPYHSPCHMNCGDDLVWLYMLKI